MDPISILVVDDEAGIASIMQDGCLYEWVIL